VGETGAREEGCGTPVPLPEHTIPHAPGDSEVAVGIFLRKQTHQSAISESASEHLSAGALRCAETLAPAERSGVSNIG
jgi:hypothetical protein